MSNHIPLYTWMWLLMQALIPIVVELISVREPLTECRHVSSLARSASCSSKIPFRRAAPLHNYAIFDKMFRKIELSSLIEHVINWEKKLTRVLVDKTRYTTQSDADNETEILLFWHFVEIFITGCTGQHLFDNIRCSRWWRFHQNDNMSVSLNEA